MSGINGAGGGVVSSDAAESATASMTTTTAATAAGATSAVAAGDTAPAVPVMVREIHKNGWLKKLPSSERRLVKPPFVKPPKPEKMWVVFCIHDDVEAFLELYENRRSAFSHQPLSSVPLVHCLHISPNIVFGQDSASAAGGDFVFSITMESRVIKLAAASREQMTEWMDTMKAKLTELGVLQPRFNVYSRGPEIRQCLASSRDPTSPLPPPPPSSASSLASGSATLGHRPTPPPRSAVSLQSVAQPETSSSRSTTNTSRLRTSLSLTLSGAASSLAVSSGRHTNTSSSQPVTPTTPPSSASPSAVSAGPVSYVRRPPPLTPPASSTARWSPGSSTTGHVGGTHFPFDDVTAPPVILTPRGGVLPTSPRALTTVQTSSVNAQAVWSPVLDSVYEPIFLPASPSADRVILGGIRNPNYYGPPRPPLPNATITAAATFERPPRLRILSRAASAIIPRQQQQLETVAGSSRGARTNGNGSSSSNNNNNYDALAFAATGAWSYHEETDGQSGNVPPSLQFTTVESGGGGSVSGVERVSGSDENNRPITLKEKQVLALCHEMNHKAGVRLHLQRKDCVNTIALIDYLGAVWIAGWKQREHPFLYHSFHIGDRIVSIGGRSVRSQSDAHRIIKNEMLPKIEFIIARIPFGKVFAIKRDHEGQPLGLVRDGNTAEIVLVEADGLAARHGLPPHSPSCEGNGLCNWVLTEVNGRPLNLFFKDNEIQDRLKAVGKDISILVQPSDFVKALRKQLKAMWGYKDYIVQ